MNEERVRAAATPAQTVIVRAGESIQDAIDSVATPDKFLGILEYLITLDGDVAEGEWFRITVKGHDTLPDSDHVYEFDGDANITQVCPTCGGPAHAIDITGGVENFISGPAAQAVIESVQGSAGDASVICLGDLMVQVNPHGGYKYMELDYHVANTTPPVSTRGYYPPQSIDTVFLVYPGLYEEQVRLYKNMHLIGVGGPESCIIRHEDSTPTDGHVVHCESYCSIIGLGIHNIYDESFQAGAFYSGVKMGTAYELCEDVLIEDCHIKCQNYPIHAANGWNKRCIVRNNILEGSNTMELGGQIEECQFIGNICRFKAESAACLAFCMTGNDKSRRNVWANNDVYLERTNAGAAPYCMFFGGWGNQIIGNRIHVVAHNCYSNNPAYFLWLNSGMDLDGETNPLPNIISGNTFILTIYGTMPSSITLLKKANVNPARYADLIFADNVFRCYPTAPAAKVITELVQTGATNAKMYIHPGGINGWEDGTLSVTKVDVIGAPQGSGAGLTPALLTAAFGDPSLVGTGFRGRYRDTSTGSEYLVWTDGTSWFYATGAEAT